MSAPTVPATQALPNFDHVEAGYAGYRNVRALLGTHDAITPQMLSVPLTDIIKFMVRPRFNVSDLADQPHLCAAALGPGPCCALQKRRGR